MCTRLKHGKAIYAKALASQRSKPSNSDNDSSLSNSDLNLSSDDNRCSSEDK
jgi:hypothetical protein